MFANATLLSHPTPDAQTSIMTDASDVAVGSRPTTACQWWVVSSLILFQDSQTSRDQVQHVWSGATRSLFGHQVFCWGAGISYFYWLQSPYLCCVYPTLTSSPHDKPVIWTWLHSSLPTLGMSKVLTIPQQILSPSLVLTHCQRPHTPFSISVPGPLPKQTTQIFPIYSLSLH